jgi:hypothetical protein
VGTCDIMADNTEHGLLSAENRKLVPQCDKCLSCVKDCVQSSGIPVQLFLNYYY